MNPLISVIIPTFNSGALVCSAIESAIKQTYQPLEIILVDDGSTDGTPELVRKFNGNIVYVRQENKGVASARNTGIGLARGEFIAFLDADDQWLPEKIAKQLEAFKRNAEVGAVHSDLWYWHPGTGNKLARKLGREKFTGDCYANFFGENRVLTSSIMVRKACFDKVGLFDENLRLAEDWDMWARIARFFKFDYILEPLLYYRVHSGSLSTNKLELEKSLLVVLKKMIGNDPDLMARVGKNKAKMIMAKVAFNIAYEHLELEDLYQARVYFLKAFRMNPACVNALIYYIICLLPRKALLYGRAIKNRVGIIPLL
jgi:glycosyltransferase involved in cell wall biosynthesis